MKQVSKLSTPLLVAKIGWAPDYAGEPVEGDDQYVQDTAGAGHERFNFKPFGRHCLGYIRTGGGPPRVRGDRCDIAFIAKDPRDKRLKLVGIYHDARLLDDYQPNPHIKQRDAKGGRYVFCARVDLSRTKLLNLDERIDADVSGGPLRRAGYTWITNEQGRVLAHRHFYLKRLAPWLLNQPKPKQPTPPPFDPRKARRSLGRIRALIRARQGQPAFRIGLLKRYARRCAMSDCNAPEALEAAHICPYTGKDSNNPTNGLLLRSDLHTLFDLHLISVNPSTMKIELAESLKASVYVKLNGQPLRKPEPSRVALKDHYERFLREQG